MKRSRFLNRIPLGVSLYFLLTSWIWVGVSALAIAAPELPPPPVEGEQTEELLLWKLNTPTEVEFKFAPIADAIDRLATKHNFVVDYKDAGLDKFAFQQVCNVKSKDLLLHEVLDLILPRRISYDCEGNVLRLTKQASDKHVTLTYEVEDLLQLHGKGRQNGLSDVEIGDEETESPADVLSNKILSIIALESWRPFGAGSIIARKDQLIVRQSIGNHRKIQCLLRLLSEAAKPEIAARAASRQPTLSDRVVKLNLHQASLHTALEALAKSAKCDLAIDADLIEYFTQGDAGDVSINRVEAPLELAFSLLVESRPLDYRERGNTLIICPRDEVGVGEDPRLYDLRSFPDSMGEAEILSGLHNFISPTMWSLPGERAQRQALVWRDQLIVIQSAAIHYELRRWLNKLNGHPDRLFPETRPKEIAMEQRGYVSLENLMASLQPQVDFPIFYPRQLAKRKVFVEPADKLPWNQVLTLAADEVYADWIYQESHVRISREFDVQNRVYRLSDILGEKYSTADVEALRKVMLKHAFLTEDAVKQIGLHLCVAASPQRLRLIQQQLQEIATANKTQVAQEAATRYALAAKLELEAKQLADERANDDSANPFAPVDASRAADSAAPAPRIVQVAPTCVTPCRVVQPSCQCMCQKPRCKLRLFSRWRRR